MHLLLLLMLLMLFPTRYKPHLLIIKHVITGWHYGAETRGSVLQSALQCRILLKLVTRCPHLLEPLLTLSIIQGSNCTRVDNL